MGHGKISTLYYDNKLMPHLSELDGFFYTSEVSTLKLESTIATVGSATHMGTVTLHHCLER